jgi:hypothetical protein
MAVLTLALDDFRSFGALTTTLPQTLKSEHRASTAWAAIPPGPLGADSALLHSDLLRIKQATPRPFSPANKRDLNNGSLGPRRVPWAYMATDASHRKPLICRYFLMEPAGFEPATSYLQSRRSPS